MVLTLLFLIIAVVLLWVSIKKEYQALGAIGIVVAFATLCMIIGLIASYYNFKTYTHEYEVAKVMLESYKGQDYGNMTELTKSVVYINDKIATHRALGNSIMLRGFYSPKVGALEPLTFNQLE